MDVLTGPAIRGDIEFVSGWLLYGGLLRNNGDRARQFDIEQQKIRG